MRHKGSLPHHPCPSVWALMICFQDKYYCDKCLAMGCSNACQIFEKFTPAVHHTYEYYNLEANYLHMLGDSFLMQNGACTCKRDLEHYIELCDDIGVPLETSKTTHPSTHTVFVGVELNVINWLSKLLMDKLTKYKVEVEQVMPRKNMCCSENGVFSWETQLGIMCCPSGPNLCKLFDMIKKVKKPFYKIRITGLNIWLTFLQNYNGITYFQSLKMISSDAIHMVPATARSGYKLHSRAHGISVTLESESYNPYMYWYQCLVKTLPTPLLPSLRTISQSHTTSTIIQANANHVHIKASGIKLNEFNIHLTAKHIMGKTNILAERIFHFQVTEKLLRDHGMDTTPTPISEHLWSGNFITSWNETCNTPCHATRGGKTNHTGDSSNPSWGNTWKLAIDLPHANT